MATFPENILGILLFCGCVMVMGVIQVTLLVELLQFKTQNWLITYLFAHVSSSRASCFRSR